MAGKPARPTQPERARGTQAGRAFAPYGVDWGAFSPLKLTARLVAEGVYAGVHRSIRKGSGVEFGGTRPYVMGDDLRFFDRRSLLKHDKLMVREFETETDRALWLVVDATASMSYRGTGPGAKYPFAALLAASLARVALNSGDPVGLAVIGGEGARSLPARSGGESFERIIWALESVTVAGDFSRSDRAFERALAPVADKARRGSMVVLFSDLFDLPPHARRAFAALAIGGRATFAVETLDPAERTLPFEEHARFRSLEGDTFVEADPTAARAEYLQRLRAIEDGWERELTGRGGGLVRATSNDDPVKIVRSIVLGLSRPAAGGPRE